MDEGWRAPPCPVWLANALSACLLCEEPYCKEKEGKKTPNKPLRQQAKSRPLEITKQKSLGTFQSMGMLLGALSWLSMATSCFGSCRGGMKGTALDVGKKSQWARAIDCRFGAVGMKLPKEAVRVGQEVLAVPRWVLSHPPPATTHHRGADLCPGLRGPVLVPTLQLPSLTA